MGDVRTRLRFALSGGMTFLLTWLIASHSSGGRVGLWSTMLIAAVVLTVFLLVRRLQRRRARGVSTATDFP